MKTRKLLWMIPVAAGIAVSVVPSGARAEDDLDPYAVDDDYDDDDAHLLTPGGMAMSIGGGIADFTDDRVDALTDLGASWTARLVIGTRQVFGLEAAYLGTVNNIDALGLDDDAMLLSNGFEGDLRLNFATGLVQPYIFGGAAWKHYNVVNESFNTSAISDGDDVLELPFGGGVALMYQGFVFDSRFDFRPAFDEEIVRPVDQTSVESGLENWNVSARVGFEF